MLPFEMSTNYCLEASKSIFPVKTFFFFWENQGSKSTGSWLPWENHVIYGEWTSSRKHMYGDRQNETPWTQLACCVERTLCLHILIQISVNRMFPNDRYLIRWLVWNQFCMSEFLRNLKMANSNMPFSGFLSPVPSPFINVEPYVWEHTAVLVQNSPK